MVVVVERPAPPVPARGRAARTVPTPPQAHPPTRSKCFSSPLILESHVNSERRIRILNRKLGKPREQERPLRRELVHLKAARLLDLNVLDRAGPRDGEL